MASASNGAITSATTKASTLKDDKEPMPSFLKALQNYESGLSEENDTYMKASFLDSVSEENRENIYNDDELFLNDNSQLKDQSPLLVESFCQESKGDLSFGKLTS